MPEAYFDRTPPFGDGSLGAIIRDQIERRGLPYHETLYGLLIDRLGMRATSIPPISRAI